MHPKYSFGPYCVISREAPDPKTTAAVSELPEPKNITELRAFLGLAGYYRGFIPNFASIASPLVELTKKGSKFVWSSKQHNGFQMLKSLLCEAPILAYPQLDQPFILQTDASDMGLGAVLTQLDSRGCERVISYGSRSLSDLEEAYSTTEKEALAVVFGTDHFRPYLLGRTFTIITDHSALHWLSSVELKGRLARWVLHLQENSFDIQHRSGSSHGNADALSRLPLPNEEVIHSQSCHTTMIPGYNLQQAQIYDMHNSNAIEMISNSLPKPPHFVWASDPIFRGFWHCWDSLHIVNGLLVKSRVKDDADTAYAFVVPTQLIPAVLEGIYSSPFSGHLSLKCTLLQTKHRFFWPQMTQHITKFVQGCESCAQNKHGSLPLKLLSSLLRSMSLLFSGPWTIWVPSRNCLGS